MAGSKVSSKVSSNVSDMATASGHARARALLERHLRRRDACVCRRMLTYADECGMRARECYLSVTRGVTNRASLEAS